MPTGDTCPHCLHPFDPHAVVAPSGDPMRGGIILCPEKGCPCFATWSPSLPGQPPIDPDVPDDVEVEAIRRQIQGGSQ